MAVVKSKRGENELDVTTFSRELAVHGRLMHKKGIRTDYCREWMNVTKAHGGNDRCLEK